MDGGQPVPLASSGRIALWGGIECTVNRVRDDYFSQLDRSGHAARLDDLERIAALGVRALRYPVLWERTAPNGVEKADWRWADERLTRLRSLGIEVIAGLVHHGSGPPHTSLIDPGFSDGLAEYAGAVARRYPWINRFTPVNEPLTTARFSGLYGVWYPHGRDLRLFWRALYQETRATVLAMAGIRRVNPAAQLVQTDDLGKTCSTPRLAYQARFNNELRWLGWDLLCGRVGREHALWSWLIDLCGASEAELDWLAEHPCPPDILGLNHYVTSERFLDERLERYPDRYHGGNGRERYADIEAARCLDTPTGGLRPLLHEAWQRYGIPLAVTEAHIDSTRDEQIRWLSELWHACRQARREGADVQAFTVWALLGSYDWNCLVTECRGYYEPGAFDLRAPRPRPTAVASLMRQIAAGKDPQHPVLAGPGWWLREGRLYCAPVSVEGVAVSRASPFGAAAPLLITGATGTLGRAFARICTQRGLAHRLLRREELDIADANSIERVLDKYRPWAIVNTAGYVRVDDAEQDVERCFRENTLGPARLAAACARHGVRLVTFSTDLVFDGRQASPYCEQDRVAPLNVYGRSKAEAEIRVLDRHPESLVVRTSAFFGPWDEYNYITVALRTLAEGRPFAAASDMTVSPTYVPDLVSASLDLLIDGEAGLWHLTNRDAVTWSELALKAAKLGSVDASRVHSCRSHELRLVAPRPAYSVLSSERSCVMPPLDDALGRFFVHCETLPLGPRT